MDNNKIAKMLYEIGDFLDIEDIKFKPRAYQKAAIAVDLLEENLGEIYNRGGIKALEKIPCVGKSIAEKIEEYILTGKIRYYAKLKKKMPVNIRELTAIQGIGAKTLKVFYKKLNIRDIQDLEKAVQARKIRKLPGFGEKTEQNILQGIAFLKKSGTRFLLGEIFPYVESILKELRKLKQVEKASVAGSVRRMKETIKDIDILVCSKNPKKVMDFFVSMPLIKEVLSKGETRASVRMNFAGGDAQCFNCDLRVVPAKSYGSALQYFTGSKYHNIAIRKIAISKGLKLNEYGIFKKAQTKTGKNIQIGGRTEKEIYNILGMDYILPELRENRGEIQASLNNNLPKIIGYNDIKGDLHCHTKWSDGANTIKEMAETAIKMGYEYIGITDHTKFLKAQNGLDEKRLLEQGKEIDKLNKEFQSKGLKFKILKSCEANILNNGSLDINNSALKKLDYVVAGVHSNFKMSKKEMTERIVRAIKNPYVKIITHPFGRVLRKMSESFGRSLKARDKYECDFDKILSVAKKFGVVLEINSQPQRLDLDDAHIRRAKQAGVKMAINTDSHHKSHLEFIKFGIGQARRGWAEKGDIVNREEWGN
ncbi:MAG: DNA polymerase/3'-5' exonuclease PolX [Patescibacteria group bacterium]|nr:DNA polymerase/3'-5' exonuclease PolX [Patescibacteria group bacterium]